MICIFERLIVRKSGAASFIVLTHASKSPGSFREPLHSSQMRFPFFYQP
jgi:hypothetical protein